MTAVGAPVVTATRGEAGTVVDVTDAEVQVVLAEAARFGFAGDRRTLTGPPHFSYAVALPLPGMAHPNTLVFGLDGLYHDLIWALPPEQWATIPPPGGIYRGHPAGCWTCQQGKECRPAVYWAQYGAERQGVLW